jgi:LuxR family maltose regulon positive regulatory protein
MAADELPFDLIEAKLAPPPVRPDSVVKRELIGRLCASEPRVVCVVAPAGFGKTTLLSNWAQRDPRAFASVALDERDNDPVVLLRYAAAALNRVVPLSPSVFEALSGPGRSVWATCIPRVSAAFAEVTDRSSSYSTTFTSSRTRHAWTPSLRSSTTCRSGRGS